MLSLGLKKMPFLLNGASKSTYDLWRQKSSESVKINKQKKVKDSHRRKAVFTLRVLIYSSYLFA